MKYKYRLCFFGSMDPKSIEEELNNMSARGYELVEMGPVFKVFKKCEPNSKKYAAVIQEEVVEFQSGINAFDEFCLEAGWVKVAKSGNILIYENEDLNATHISTDASVEYKNVRHFMKQSTIQQAVLLVAGGYFTWYLAFNKALAGILDCLADYATLFAVIMAIAILLIFSLNVMLGIHWLVKSDKLMKTSNQYIKIEYISKVMNVEAVLFLALFIGFVIFMFMTRNILVGIHYISYILFLFVIVTFSNKVINQVERDYTKEEKLRKRIGSAIKLVVFIIAALIYFATPDGSTDYDSEGTIWLYKEQKILWEGDYYIYELYYPKYENIYGFVLETLEQNVGGKKIIREKDGNIFVIEEDTPIEYQEMILEKTVKF